MRDDDLNIPDEEDISVDIFEEPEGFYAPDKQATSTQYTFKDGQTLKLRLVGHSSLWGHLIWNAGRVISKYLEDNPDIVKGKTVLELGAGAGLPSLVAAALGARKVVATDYPEANLIDNLRYNIEHGSITFPTQSVHAEGFLWGNNVEPLRAYLGTTDTEFDVLILADILFNHSEHDKLASTVKAMLKREAQSRALVFFTPYRPWLLEKDLAFFETVKAVGLSTRKLFEHTMDEVMFEHDPGDELLRRTVFAFEVFWPSLATST